MDAVLQFIWIMVGIVLIMAPLMLCVAYTTYAERKIIGYIQVRIGPNRVGPRGWLQPIADAVKLMFQRGHRTSGCESSFVHHRADPCTGRRTSSLGRGSLQRWAGAGRRQRWIALRPCDDLGRGVRRDHCRLVFELEVRVARRHAFSCADRRL